jgi:hypothetical protein
MHIISINIIRGSTGMPSVTIIVSAGSDMEYYVELWMERKEE